MVLARSREGRRAFLFGSCAGVQQRRKKKLGISSINLIYHTFKWSWVIAGLNSLLKLRNGSVYFFHPLSVVQKDAFLMLGKHPFCSLTGLNYRLEMRATRCLFVCSKL